MEVKEEGKWVECIFGIWGGRYVSCFGGGKKEVK